MVTLQEAEREYTGSGLTANENVMEYTEPRTGGLRKLMDGLNKNPRSYESQGLFLVRNLTVDPRSASSAYLPHRNGSTIYVNDLPLREETILVIASDNPDKSKTELLKMVDDERKVGANK